MASAREVRLRIRSVRNIAQVTRALQTISASRVRKAQEAVLRTRPYARKAWEILQHLSYVPEGEHLHPLLAARASVERVLVVLVTSDRGLAGAYNSNVIRFTLEKFRDWPQPISYVAVGRKGRDVLHRLGKDLRAEFTRLPAEPDYADVSSIGVIAIDEFRSRAVDQVHLVYTDFINLLRQQPTSKQLLPLEMGLAEARVQAFEDLPGSPPASFIYEPAQEALIDHIMVRFTQLQLYQAVLESQASEHAARMVAMQSATENALDLSAALTLEYNKARQLAITNDMLDIAGGAEALTKAT
ncbi:MAG TPA: ATP synthase F1 subunit gamma [Anaerolineales bacterium]